MAGALSGYRILDLTDEKGMLSTRLLAGMGAEVIRVEKPGAPPGENSDLCYLNAGKRSISLDLEKKAGREIFKRLVGMAQVLVETCPPGHLDSLGLGYSELTKTNPGLVMAAITEFGQTGPYRNYKSSDLVAGALGGWLSICGEPDAPLKPYGSQSYYAASLFAANGILLALWGRHGTGRGQFLDISVMECVSATLDHALVRYIYEGVVAGRTGNRYWNNYFQILPCKDGHILISLFYGWETLVELLDSEGMAEDLTDVKWREREARAKGSEHVISVLQEWTKKHTAAELVAKGQLMRFPWAEITSVPELMASPQLAQRNYFTEIECRETGKKYTSPGAPFKMSASPWQPGDGVATAGEDNLSIYRGELGLSAPRIRALARAGVI